MDLNDPSTWPDDNAALLELANTGVVETPDEAEEAPVETPVAAPEAPVEKDAPKEEGPILAEDGKNTIPYRVLRETRSQLQETQAQLQALQAQLDAAKAAPAPAPAAPTPAPVSNELPDDVKARIEKVRENWGDDIAAQTEQQYWLEQRLLTQQQTIEQLTQSVQKQTEYISTREQAAKQSEVAQIEDAIAASPKLDLWAKAEDQTWFDRATATHEMLLKTDKSYAAKSWFDRMKALPDRVEALYGASLERVDTPNLAGVAAAKVQAAKGKAVGPTSLSEISGGSIPEASEIARLEDLKGNQLTSYMTKLAQDPLKFEAYLRSIA